jgi:hypothetical protein
MSATATAASTAAAPPFDYTSDELRSYLPSGWAILDGGRGAWDPKRRTLTVRILDNVDFDWPVTVTAAAAGEHGRLEALRLAMDDTFRSRLGRPTRGLGVSPRR